MIETSQALQIRYYQAGNTNMATLEQLQNAFVKADAAGEEKDAQTFADSIRAHPTFQQNAKEELDSGTYKLGGDGFTELGKDEQRANMSKQVARSMGLKDSEVDVTQGMGTYGRFKLSFQPTEQDKVKHLEDTYGRENIRAVDIGGKMKLLYRDEQETGNQFRAVDEEGTSLADFFGDTAGEVLPVAGAIAGGVAGLAGGIPGSIAGAAAGGALARGAQDITTRALSGEEQQFGEMGGRLAKEAAIGAVVDVATLGTGRLASKLFKSKLTGDASAQAFAKVSGDVPEGAFTPRMMQGEEALTREVGIEGQVGGRVGDARQAIHSAAEREVGQVSTEAFEKFTQAATKERDELIKSVPAGDKKLAAQIEKQYQDKIKRFGAGEGRVVSDIGDEVITKSVEPALKASRIKKNALYKTFEAADKEAGGIFTAREVGNRFKRVIAKNGMKNTTAVESIQKEIAKQEKLGRKYTLSEIDDLISNVTDAMPDGVLKNRTAQQVAAQLSDSLDTLVKNKAKKHPALNQAWKDANTYYKDTYTKFGRGGIGGATKDVSGETVLSGQGFINSILGDPRQIKNILSVAKEGGMKPAVLKGRLKEAFLTSKGVHKGQALKLSQADRGVVQELWGKRGLKRLESIERGMKAKPDDLEAYLGALSDRQAAAAKKTMAANAAEQVKLDRFTQNRILKQLTDGDLPVENPEAITKAFIGAKDSQRKEILKRMEPAEIADLRSIVGADVLATDLYNSGFKNAIGEHMFNGTSVLNKLKGKRAAYIDALGKKEYQKLVDLADAQSRLAPLNKQEAQARLRTTFGAKGISLFVVGDMLQSIKDKVVSLAYRTKSLDKFASGWSKADPDAIKSALDTMLVGSRANRALIDMDDPEFEADLRQIRSAME